MPRPEAAMSLQNILDALQARDGAAFAELVSTDCDFRAPGFRTTGPDQAWVWMSAFLDAIPDIDHRLATTFAAGDREAAELEITGTHTRPLVSAAGEIPASGRPIRIEACDMLTYDGSGR